MLRLFLICVRALCIYVFLFFFFFLSLNELDVASLFDCISTFEVYLSGPVHTFFNVVSLKTVVK